MAWSELTARRHRRSRTWADDADPTKRHLTATPAPLCYDSQPGANDNANLVDFSVSYVSNAQFDGWRATSAGWHYAVGQDLENHGSEDGWVGFGGRGGQHWFKFRLTRIQWIRWSTRQNSDIAGAPTYDREMLNRIPVTVGLGPAQQRSTQTVGQTVAWTHLWETPGGGAVEILWKADGARLKEEVKINAAARTWIAANRPPPWAANQSYLSLVFEIDWTDIPKIVRAGVLQDRDGDFEDDGEPLELRNDLDELLAFLTIDELYVDDGETRTATPLHKRFYKDSGTGKYYLLVGARADLVNGLPAGDLVFDPTVNSAPGAANDDAYQNSVTPTYGGIARTSVFLWARANATDSQRNNFGVRFDGLTLDGNAGDTITAVDLQGTIYGSNTNPNLTLYLGAFDDAADFTTVGPFQIFDEGDVGSGESWITTGVTGTHSIPITAAQVQAVIDRVGWASGNAAMVLAIANSDNSNSYAIQAYDNGSDWATLEVDYTAGAGGGFKSAWAQGANQLIGRQAA